MNAHYNVSRFSEMDFLGMNKYVLPCGYSEPFLYYNINEDDHASDNEIFKDYCTHGPS